MYICVITGCKKYSDYLESIQNIQYKNKSR